MTKLLSLLIIILFLSACSKETTVQVMRNPLIQFTGNSALWKAGNYSLTKPVQVVGYPANSNQSGQLYNRFTLQANGKNDKGEDLQLNIVFDASNADQLKGIYRPAYTSETGLYEVQLFTLDNDLSAYSLCSGSSASMLQIQRHSQAERLISGSFQMMLCNVRDTAQKIQISDGIINDIHY